jgi:hypothetical protein
MRSFRRWNSRVSSSESIVIAAVYRRQPDNEGMAPSRCTGCGLLVEGGTQGCREIFTGLGVRAWEDARIGRLQWILVDAYALQHPDEFCASAKSFAAHLTGLCAGLEHADDPTLRPVLQRWLNGRSPVTKPELPDVRGSLTVADVHAAAGSSEYERVVDAWTRDVWTAYAPFQALAREWIAGVLAK